MRRRAILAAPPAAALISALPAQAQAPAAALATEEFMVPSGDPGIEIFVRRGKRLLGLTEPGKELLAVVERILLDVGRKVEASVKIKYSGVTASTGSPIRRLAVTAARRASKPATS